MGLLWLKNASYWNISGLAVQWSPHNKSTEHMVKFTGGTGWALTNSTLSGARSFAALLIAGEASDWVVAHNTIRDTFRANGPNQDHLIYVNSSGKNGLIERNVLLNSPNGRAIKVGPPTATAGRVTGGLIIRYNTMQHNLGPSNIQLAWHTSNVLIERNIMLQPAAGRSAVTAFELSGQHNVVRDNLVWDAVRVLDSGVPGLIDGGGNVLADPARYSASYGAGAK